MADRDLTDLAEQQDGLLTRRQALELGVSSRQFDRRRRCGPWQTVLPGVVATFTGRLTDHQRRRAGLLYAGPRTSGAVTGAVLLAGATAADQYGLRTAPRATAVEVLVAAPRHVGLWWPRVCSGG